MTKTASASTQLDLVFLWHMHQPDYRDHQAASHVLPWTYLHALKDYTDMATHLERHPQVHAVVNFVPVLLEQIEDYADQFAHGDFRDPLLRLLAAPDLERLKPTERDFLLQTCFLSNHTTMLDPFPCYKRLHELYLNLIRDGKAGLAYLSGAYFADLVTWYHLAWTGESERRRQPLLAELMSKGEGYSSSDRRALLALIGEAVSDVIPRYRRLAERGQIELSTTPQTHPLAPLLLDFKVALETQPEAPLPCARSYPGGRSRVAAQIDAAQASHTQRFGKLPLGMWPAEGAISTAFIEQLAMQGCRWIASGEGVLRASLAQIGQSAERAAYHPWRLEKTPGLTLFFRDERLSDLIGFEYAKWYGRDAARHLIGELEAILAATLSSERALVSIIMDGENAWEHYPYNGYYFFEELYVLLEAHPQIRTTTYSAVLARAEQEASSLPVGMPLPHLTAGSWVFGNFATWIGGAEKNRAWDLLCSAKQRYDQVMSSERLDETQRHAASVQLAICESSDWFWWFGDYNPTTAVTSFDQLFRRNLANLYHLLGLLPPAQLDAPICAESSAPQNTHSISASGVMRRSQDSAAS